MYLLANALKNLLRNKGRNILIATVTLAIIISTVVTLTIANASAKIIEDMRLQMGSKVNISLDLMAQYQSGQGAGNNTALSINDYLSYAKSSYLDKSIFNVQVPMYSSTVFAIDDESKGQSEWQGQDGTSSKAATMMLVGNSDPSTMADFGTKRNIIDGKMFSGLDECIISSELANLNGIHVGDKISIDSSFKPVQNYNLTVTGIYSDETDAYTNQMYQQRGLFVYNQRNQVITSYDTVMAKGYKTDEGIDFKADYYLKNPDDLSKFEAEVRAKGCPASYSVSIDKEKLDKVTGPLAGMKGVTQTFMIVILILGGIVLILLSFIAVRERKYEVGVLRAMGMEKGKIALGMLTEAFIVTAMCLIVGLGIGSTMSQPIANGILSDQVAAAKAESANAGGGKFLMSGGKTQTSGANNYTPISEIRVALDTNTIMQIAIIALILAVLSGTIGVVVITKYEPLKILRERN